MLAITLHCSTEAEQLVIRFNRRQMPGSFKSGPSVEHLVAPANDFARRFRSVILKIGKHGTAMSI